MDHLADHQSSALALCWCLLLLALLIYYLVWSQSRFVKLIDAIPGPRAYPILGNLLDVANVDHDGDLSTANTVALTLLRSSF